MNELIEFISANSWEERIFVNPDEIGVIERYHKDRDMGEYSQIVLTNGTRIFVRGLPLGIAQKVRNAK